MQTIPTALQCYSTRIGLLFLAAGNWTRGILFPNRERITSEGCSGMRAVARFLHMRVPSGAGNWGRPVWARGREAFGVRIQFRLTKRKDGTRKNGDDQEGIIGGADTRIVGRLLL